MFICSTPVFTRHFEYSKFPHLFAPAERYARKENDFDYLRTYGAGARAAAFESEKDFLLYVLFRADACLMVMCGGISTEKKNNNSELTRDGFEEQLVVVGFFFFPPCVSGGCVIATFLPPTHPSR